MPHIPNPVLWQTKAGEMSLLGESPCTPSPVIYFKVDVDREKREFWWSADNQDWRLAGAIPDARFLSDEAGGEYAATQDGGPRLCRHKAFTGTMVGIYANNGENGAVCPADFDWFDYQGHEVDSK